MSHNAKKPLAPQQVQEARNLLIVRAVQSNALNESTIIDSIKDSLYKLQSSLNLLEGEDRDEFVAEDVMNMKILYSFLSDLKTINL